MSKRTRKKTIKKTKRYVSVSYRDIKGIRKDVKSNTFLVEKRIRGKRYFATFKTARDAADWKKNFHPSVNFTPLGNSKKSKAVKKLSELINLRTQGAMAKNGTDLGLHFKDAWDLYLEKHSMIFEFTTFEKTEQKGKYFLKDLMNVPMVELNAMFISNYLEIQKEKAIKNKIMNGKVRYQFTGDLKILKTMLNWYRENIDPMFVNPYFKKASKGRHYLSCA